ncbi:MAG: DUF1902 domain-containing protein [Rhodospirillales bacterium]|nr:DUF1902 domain-containing protein [Rhodospirillales bacterium]
MVSPDLSKGAVSKPVIFTITAAWDGEASVGSGHCDNIPAAADASTLDELLAKISAMALDLLPDNHPDNDPASLFFEITALRETEPVAAKWRRILIGITVTVHLIVRKRPPRVASGRIWRAVTRRRIASTVREID